MVVTLAGELRRGVTLAGELRRGVTLAGELRHEETLAGALCFGWTRDDQLWLWRDS